VIVRNEEMDVAHNLEHVDPLLRRPCPLQFAFISVSGFKFGVWGFRGSRVSSSSNPRTGFQVSGFGFRVSGFGFRVSGLGLRGGTCGEVCLNKTHAILVVRECSHLLVGAPVLDRNGRVSFVPLSKVAPKQRYIPETKTNLSPKVPAGLCEASITNDQQT
jgi:hypothetical protein